jgi:6-pyruvoyltetrahydropterin/6-carboxytetrahydropterin synthase
VFSIIKTIEFSASHELRLLPADHQCHRNHGHNYEVEIELEGEELDELGMLCDYGELSKAIKGRFDHNLLNDDESLGDQPTAERLAAFIAQIVVWDVLRPLNAKRVDGNKVQVTRVRVSETASSHATWRGRA